MKKILRCHVFRYQYVGAYPVVEVADDITEAELKTALEGLAEQLDWRDADNWSASDNAEVHDPLLQSVEPSDQQAAVVVGDVAVDDPPPGRLLAEACQGLAGGSAEAKPAEVSPHVQGHGVDELGLGQRGSHGAPWRWEEGGERSRPGC